MRHPILVALLIAAFAAPSSAQELSDQQVIETLSSQQPRDRAIQLGLGWLRSVARADGSLGEVHGTAITGLAVMAHLSAGIAPDDPEQGAWLRRSLMLILSRQDPNGYFGGKDDSRMYGHGIATLCVAEALGATRDPDLDERLRGALEKAVAVTVNAARVKKDERNRGGWRYQPQSNDSDLSLSGWQLMSLVAARQVGITVPEEVVVNAVDYARRQTTPDGKVGYDKVGEDKPALRGLALLALAIAPRDREADRQLSARIAARIQADPLQWEGKWVLYRAHYDAIGLSRAAPELWDAYGPRLVRVLVEKQKPDGSWPSPPGSEEASQGPAYTTAMAILALAVDRHVLPAFQR